MLACYRHIELNPVRAGLVAHARDYYWSSYRANAQGEIDPVVSAHPAYADLGDCFASRAAAYRGLFDVNLPDSEIEQIRRATRGGYRIGEQRRRRGRQSRREQEQPELPGLESASK